MTIQLRIVLCNGASSECNDLGRDLWLILQSPVPPMAWGRRRTTDCPGSAAWQRLTVRTVHHQRERVRRLPIDRSHREQPRTLSDPGVYRATVPLDVARKSDVHREASHVTPPLWAGTGSRKYLRRFLLRVSPFSICYHNRLQRSRQQASHSYEHRFSFTTGALADTSTRK